MKFFKTVLLPLTLLCTHLNTSATTMRVLFLGNSYVAVNNLPQIVSDIATFNNDTLIFNSYSPGGYTLQSHFNDANSIALINQGNWDYVVLQEQSQLPSFPLGQVQISVYPYAHKLDSVINASNACAETMFYMTWGRKNGDASNCSSWPPVCTYEGMDSLLNLRYRTMAFDNNAIVSPVGAVWNYIRNNFPSIELYQSDESHPSAAGSYAAACSFYSGIFRKDPTSITYDYGLDSATAASIRFSTEIVEFDSINYWYIGAYDPKASFNYVNMGVNEVLFQNISLNSTSYFWDFNDGSNSNTPNPTHIFSAPGQYNVSLVSYKCNYSDTSVMSVNVLGTDIQQNDFQNDFTIYPNPASSFFEIRNLNSTNSISEISIMDALGKTVFTSRISSVADLSIDTRQYPRGVYFITLSTKDNFRKSFPLILN